MTGDSGKPRVTDAFAVARDFDKASYFQSLALTASQLNRVKDAADPKTLKQKLALIDDLFGLVGAGRRYADLALERRERRDFHQRIKRIASESGFQLAVADDPKPWLRSDAEFSGRLPHITRERGAAGSEWYLLQMATKKTQRGVRVIGVAQTGRCSYSLFEGVEGDLYVAREMDLPQARNAMSAAFRNGFVEIPRSEAENRMTA